MQVSVAFFGQVRTAVPAGQLGVEIVEGATVDDLLVHLTGSYGPAFERAVRQEDGMIWSTVAVLVNGHNVDLAAGLKTSLSDGDSIAIVPVITGG